MATDTIAKRSTGALEWLFPVAAVTLVFVMLVPVPAIVLDILLSMSITLGVLVLLSALYILRPVQFSVFPTMLAVPHTVPHLPEHRQQPPHSSARQ